MNLKGRYIMADDKKIILTAQGLKDLQDELQNLKVVRRKEVAAKIKEARAQGDLSENAEYDAAKEEQAEIETRITQIEAIFRNYKVIEGVNTGRVNLGNTVTLYDVEMEEEITYTLVGPAEANPLEGKLSNESPLGVAMLGHAVGEKIYSEAPDGTIVYEIRDIKLN
jgi:transcription elongation factor GreA